MQTTAPTTLIDSVWNAQGQMRIVRNVALILFGTALLWVSAKIKVDIGPVPFTMQTAVVLMIGAVYGWKLGGATLMAYLAEGAAGLPVFAGTPEKGIGLAYMSGATAGYLVGFVLAAIFVGFIAERGAAGKFFALLAAMVGGVIIIDGLGLVWMMNLFGIEKGWQYGVAPFIVVDLAKAALAAAAVSLAGWAAFKR